jgi:hypothetical protein
MAWAVQAGQQVVRPDKPTASYLLRLQQRKKAFTVLLTQAMICAHLLQGSLYLAYVFAFPLERDQQPFLFG